MSERVRAAPGGRRDSEGAAGGPSGDAGRKRLVAWLKRRFGVHAIVLYGSRARGEATGASDWDLLAIRRGAKRERLVRELDGLALDLFVETDAALKAPLDVGMLRLRGGVVLLDERGAGRRLLERVEALHRRGARRLIPGEAQALRRWAWKMVDRAREGGVYGDYRKAALLTELLWLDDELRRRFFPGPKQALAVLPPRMRRLWARALGSGARLRDVELLVRAVVGPRR